MQTTIKKISLKEIKEKLKIFTSLLNQETNKDRRKALKKVIYTFKFLAALKKAFKNNDAIKLEKIKNILVRKKLLKVL